MIKTNNMKSLIQVQLKMYQDKVVIKYNKLYNYISLLIKLNSLVENQWY